MIWCKSGIDSLALAARHRQDRQLGLLQRQMEDHEDGVFVCSRNAARGPLDERVFCHRSHFPSVAVMNWTPPRLSRNIATNWRVPQHGPRVQCFPAQALPAKRLQGHAVGFSHMSPFYAKMLVVMFVVATHEPFSSFPLLGCSECFCIARKSTAAKPRVLATTPLACACRNPFPWPATASYETGVGRCSLKITGRCLVSCRSSTSASFLVFVFWSVSCL